jgi:hypothetical protein
MEEAAAAMSVRRAMSDARPEGETSENGHAGALIRSILLPPGGLPVH